VAVLYYLCKLHPCYSYYERLSTNMMLTPKIDDCRACESSGIESIWELANSPYGDSYKALAEEAYAAKYESLTLGFCHNCKLLQLLEITDLSSTYDDYLYRSSVTNALNSYYEQISLRLISEYSLEPEELVLDIGSNDGTFLLNFKKEGFKVLGVEPTQINAKTAESRGITTINEYFQESTVKRILQEAGHPRLISVNYTLANIPNLHSFLDGITQLMGEKTVLSIITGYHPDQYGVNMFEYINHDHLTYLTVESLGNLCAALSLKIIDVNRSEHKGGSVQFIIVKETSSFKVHSSVTQLLQREIWLRSNTPEFTRKLALQISGVQKDLDKELKHLKYDSIYGIGASISTTYLCNQFNLSDKIDKLFDDDVNKIGRFSPGSGLQVNALKDLPTGNSSLAIILAWQHSEKLLSRLKEVGFSGKVLTPLPFPQILEH
jgi:hypothetical protein